MISSYRVCFSDIKYKTNNPSIRDDHLRPFRFWTTSHHRVGVKRRNAIRIISRIYGIASRVHGITIRIIVVIFQTGVKYLRFYVIAIVNVVVAGRRDDWRRGRVARR